MESEILDLLDEDDFGSWELWWQVSNLDDIEEPERVTDSFVETIEQMISRGIIKAKRKSERSGKLEVVPFSSRELADEIAHASSPAPDKFFWFGK
jgi:hypothetical protein